MLTDCFSPAVRWAGRAVMGGALVAGGFALGGPVGAVVGGGLAASSLLGLKAEGERGVGGVWAV